MNPLNSNAGLTAQLARLNKTETTGLADAKRTMITRIPAGAVALKVVALSPGLPKLTSDVIAAIDRAVAGSTIEPVAMSRVYQEERLQAVKEATNLTADEKTASLDRITKQIADLDLKLGSFKGSPAYNAFLAEYANYSKGKEAS